MMYVSSESIIKLFSLMNDAFPYVLIRNVDKELPGKLRYGKDIDLLVDHDDVVSITEFLNKKGFKEIRHPHKNGVYLYNVNKYRMFRNDADGILLDLNFHLLVRSLDAGQWIPLDQEIQRSFWANRKLVKKEDGFSFWYPCAEDEFVGLVARAIFDKKEFNASYIDSIESLIGHIDREDVLKKLTLVFFKFSSVLLDMLERKDYARIIDSYVTYKDY